MIPDDPINQCWSCGELFHDGDGMSLHGTGEEVCCRECWEKIPVDRRLLLAFVFRSRDHGGSGVSDLFGIAVSSPFWIPRDGQN